jgi:hypothetical protein
VSPELEKLDEEVEHGEPMEGRKQFPPKEEDGLSLWA